MVILIIISPLIFFAAAIVYVMTKTTAFFDRMFPKKKEKYMTNEELAEKIRLMAQAQARKEARWDKAGEISKFTFKYIVFPAMGLLLIYYVFITGMRIGWLSVLIKVGVGLVAVLSIFGLVVLFEKIGSFLNKGIKSMWSKYNPFKWKGFTIIGEMIVATYTNMCPLITWEGKEDESI